MKTVFYSAMTACVVAVCTAAAFVPPDTRVVRGDFAAAPAPVEKFHGVKKMKAPARESGAVTADFTVAGASTREPVYIENFDSGQGGWTLDPASDVVRSVKRIAEPGSAKSFSAIDPDDISSLYVEGPYQTFKRAISRAASPATDVPANAVLSFYAGFSQNFDGECRLELEACTPADTIHLWNSSEETGEKLWRWHSVSVNLEHLAGQSVSFRFTYGPGADDMFGTGGYSGDFAIDSFSVSAAAPVESVSVMTGETVAFADLSSGSPVKWEWVMPGAVPDRSDLPSPEVYYTADGTYDVSLTVTDADGNTSVKTRTGFVSVTGTAPVARILPPATFRLSSTRRHLVAPLVPITFEDASTGFPDSWQWTFSGVDPDGNRSFTSDMECPDVAYSFLHNQTVTLHASNSHGASEASCDVSVEYSGVVNNLHPDDLPTVFDMEDWGVFPGSNTRKITAYAERFSRPSRPVMVDGAYVFFTKAQATELADQIANVGVHIYTSKDGRPDKRLDSMWWSVFELDTPGAGGDMVGTSFPFTDCPVVDDEFFIVVDGLPEYSEGCCVSFAMAGFRDSDNTALMLKDGEWIEVNEYFGADKCTSFMIYPSLHHSVMSLLPAGTPPEIELDGKGGVTEILLFSYMGYKTPVDIDADWLRLTGEPNGLTVDTLLLETDPQPAGALPRTAHLTLTDGVTDLCLTVTQKAGEVGVESVTDDGTDGMTCPPAFERTLTVSGLEPGDEVTVCNVAGQVMACFRADDTSVSADASAWPRGLYIVSARGASRKTMKVR